MRRAGAALVTDTLRHALEEWKLAPAELHQLLQNAKSVEIQTNGLVPTGSTLLAYFTMIQNVIFCA